MRKVVCCNKKVRYNQSGTGKTGTQQQLRSGQVTYSHGSRKPLYGRDPEDGELAWKRERNDNLSLQIKQTDLWKHLLVPSFPFIYLSNISREASFSCLVGPFLTSPQ